MLRTVIAFKGIIRRIQYEVINLNQVHKLSQILVAFHELGSEEELRFSLYFPS